MLSKKFIDCVLVAIHAFSLLEKVFNCSNRAIKLSAVPRRKRAGVIKQAFQVLCNLQAQLLRLRHMNIYPIMMPFVEPAYETNDVFSTIMRRKTYFFKMTGETVESFLSLLPDIRRLYCQRYNVYQVSNLRNKLLIVFIWLRRYNKEDTLAAWFGLHQSSISRYIQVNKKYLSWE